MKTFLLLSCFCLSASFLLIEEDTNSNPFSLVVLPDTQRYSETFPDIYYAQTNWIKNNQANENIVFVSHEGDIVQNFNNQDEWNRAKGAMSILDNANIPYGVLPGNTDMSPGRNTSNYNAAFPYFKYSGKPWYGGNYPAGTNDNSYQFFSGGGCEFLIFHLIFAPTSDVISWANSIISDYPDKKVIITTHGFIDQCARRCITHRSGGATNFCNTCSNPQYMPGSMEYLWEQLIYPNENIFLVLCGHEIAKKPGTDIISPFMSRRTDLNQAGKQVTQIFANYQELNGQESGYLRVLKFFPLLNKIEVKTYSPTQNKFLFDGTNQFSFTFNMEGC